MALQGFTPLTDKEEALAKKIKAGLKTNHVGEDKAISSSYMIESLKKFNIKTTPEVIRKIINHLRHEGCPICSSDKGYWWAGNKKELIMCAAALKDRIEAQQSTLNNLIKLIEDYDR